VLKLLIVLYVLELTELVIEVSKTIVAFQSVSAIRVYCNSHLSDTGVCSFRITYVSFISVGDRLKFIILKTLSRGSGGVNNLPKVAAQ